MKIYEKIKKLLEKEGIEKTLEYLEEVEDKADQADVLMSYNLIYKF